MKKLFAAAVAATLISAPTQAADIVDTAVSAGSFNTLVAAVSAAGLVDTLKGDGPFTVWAPTDAAFAALPAGTVETLLKPENKDQLIAILLHHVDDRLIPSEILPHRRIPVRPINGKVCITRSASGVTVSDSTGESANVITADIMTDNGVIHVIDKVLIPGKITCNPPKKH